MVSFQLERVGVRLSYLRQGRNSARLKVAGTLGFLGTCR